MNIYLADACVRKCKNVLMVFGSKNLVTTSAAPLNLGKSVPWTGIGPVSTVNWSRASSTVDWKWASEYRGLEMGECVPWTGNGRVSTVYWKWASEYRGLEIGELVTQIETWRMSTVDGTGVSVP